MRLCRLRSRPAPRTGFTADDYLEQTAVSDTAELEPIVAAVLAANPSQVEAYRGGKDGLLGFFVGQVMKETGGKANPKVVNELVREKLSVVIDEANDALQAKGYSAAHLSAVAAPLPGKVLLKGTKILSPFSDTEEVVVRVARDFVPSGSGARAADADSARDSRLAERLVILRRRLRSPRWLSGSS